MRSSAAARAAASRCRSASTEGGNDGSTGLGASGAASLVSRPLARHTLRYMSRSRRASCSDARSVSSSRVTRSSMSAASLSSSSRGSRASSCWPSSRAAWRSRWFCAHSSASERNVTSSSEMTSWISPVAGASLSSASLSAADGSLRRIVSRSKVRT